MFKSRKNPRASRHDYNGEGVYFITICTKDRIHYFGEINDNKMDYTEIGKTCIKEIEQTIKIRSSVYIHEYVIMPNHAHLLMAVFEKNDENTGRPAGTSLQGKKQKQQSLGSIISNIKARITKYANSNNIQFARQPRYHDHIIRNEKEYEKIKLYIQENIINREKDDFHDKKP